MTADVIIVNGTVRTSMRRRPLALNIATSDIYKRAEEIECPDGAAAENRE
jgi:hypothetical protein